MGLFFRGRASVSDFEDECMSRLTEKALEEFVSERHHWKRNMKPR